MKLKHSFLVAMQSVFVAVASFAAPLPETIVLDSGWQLQRAPEISRTPIDISWTGLDPGNEWRAATVPGTVLTSLVNDGVYPEPLYGENNRPDKIPELLCRESYWYRTVFRTPRSYAGRKIWLHLDGINYSADVWVNGTKVGSMKGAFARGVFDVTSLIKPGKKSAMAVLVAPEPHPGWPHEHTLFDGSGTNDGITTIDGPTFHSTIGCDWMPAIRDRDTGIWDKVYLTATGPVVIADPLVTTDLPLPKLAPAEVTVQVTLTNTSDKPQHGTLKAEFGNISLSTPVDIAPKKSKVVSLDPKSFPEMRVEKPQLWWPNRYGPQNLYKLHLEFEIDGAISDQKETSFGIRKITYAAPDSDNLVLSVNGVRVFCKGGNWGMDEAMKRNPRARLEAEIRMHQIANYTMIRNWCGQSSGEDFYEMCDKYGLLVWDEFFQPRPGDGPEPEDVDTYVANVRDKILRYRNHPSIAIWCARGEGSPATNIDSALHKLLKELEPSQLYLAGSDARPGIDSRGPYYWRPPREFYNFNEKSEVFKTETGSISVPTLDSIQGMMPKNDWDSINDDWAEHDLAKGPLRGDQYPKILADRFGKVLNLADFARKGQMANYEAYRAMYESRNAKMFAPCTGVLTWMSNPAQPSFAGQIYHHDLEPNASFFAAKKACEPIHIQMNERNWDIEVINNLARPLEKARATVSVFNIDGSNVYQREFEVEAPPSAEMRLGTVDWPTNLSAVHFIKLELRDKEGKLSDNFYWRAAPDKQDNFQALEKLPTVTLDAEVAREDRGDKCLLNVKLRNSSSHIALMTHLQLRHKDSHDRVLPAYYSDNYVSFAPGETKTITVEAALAAFKIEDPVVMIDGWNVAIKTTSTGRATVALNEDAQVKHGASNGLPIHVQ
ncbi:MAG TPA: glycoside hydrolase family 2 TIM barrel-domain containing protein [Verrucomicrobiae bacterium]|jgi:hypothetical protein